MCPRFRTPATTSASNSSAKCCSRCAATTAAVRVFHNVCRHRAARLLDGPRGNCARRIVCPYHAWSYDFEGRLASVGDRTAFPHLDISRESLVPVEMEIYQGFVFARIQGAGPSVARDDGAVSRRDCDPRIRQARAHRPGDPAPAPRQLEERRRQLLGRPAHSGRAPRAHALVRSQLSGRVARMGGSHGGRHQRQALAQLGRARLSEMPARRPRTCQRTSAVRGCTSSCGRTSPSMCIRTRWTSCSGSRSRPRRR